MECRSIVVIYRGEEVPKNILERFMNDLRTFAEADVNSIDAFTLDGKDICKSIINKTASSIITTEAKAVQDALEYIHANYFDGDNKSSETICLVLYTDYLSNRYSTLNSAINTVCKNQTSAKALAKSKNMPAGIVDVITKVKLFAGNV